MQKIFIIGLPRTATTSLCVACLELGFKTAHTAYTNAALSNAQVIADTPIFSEYPKLDHKFPGAKFIYLQRDLELWLPSIKQLLNRMSKNLLRTDGGFNPHLKKSYCEVFSPFTLPNINNDEFLIHCYRQHERKIKQYFLDRPQDLLSIDVAKNDSYQKLVNFLESEPKNVNEQNFKRINIAGKVTAWNDIKHPNKIASTTLGKIDKLLFE
ncbi:sulfotransferase family protein [Thalassotalea atypica]|uniref:sulfotransferase family protein n=1 Tax=Thalassotalea atypica TaxID=2054316 RepID=UPI002573445A|nr:sulfotransferase family protein [Thalassotalea atypica]